MNRLPPESFPPGAQPSTGPGRSPHLRIRSTHALIDACLIDDAGQETRFELQDKTGHVFHGIVPELTAGSRYGFRVTGPWNPANGLRHKVNKLLLDPYAKAITGDYTWGQAVFGHDLFHPETMDPSDSLGSVPLSVVIDHDAFDWGDDRPPLTPLEETIVYETHVKGFTARHPGVPEELRGTYAGLAHPAAIQHLTDLGVTAVELMPVHQFVQDSHLLEKGLRNYWGYNSIGFLAPHGGYSHAGDDGGQVDEFKTMVKAGEQRQRLPPGGPRADHGLAALLGDRSARRRVPV